MKLRCPKCQTVNTFEDGEALRCDSCGFDGKRIEGVTAPATTGAVPASGQVTAQPTTSDVAPTTPGSATGPAPAPIPLPGTGEAGQAEDEWPEESDAGWDESMWPDEPETATEQRTDGFSVTGLITGIVGMSLLAIIFSAVGISRCNKHEDLKGKGMAIAGLVLGIIWLIISIALAYLAYATTILDGYI